MRKIHKYLKILSGSKRKRYHPLTHHIHKKYHISKRTIFYLKEYGPNSNVANTIIKESLKILLLTSLVSSFGGLALEEVKSLFITIIPLVILLPALNDMIGNYGSIISSRFTTLLHEGKLKKKVWTHPEIIMLFAQIFCISLFTAITGAGISLGISYFSNFELNWTVAVKIFIIALLNTLVLVNLIFVLAILAGTYFYRKKEDPNNFLIPITTSIADFGNMFVLALLVILFF